MTAKENPLVTILIPVFNGEDYLSQAIESALAQSYSPLEILVIDDGSTDGTENIVKKFGDKLRYIKKPNGGVASALNLGIKEAKGELVSWLSHDDVYLPEKIQTQINFMQEQKEDVELIYCDVEYIDDNSKTLSITNYQKDHNLKHLNHGVYPVLKGFVNGCALLIKKKLFDRVGYFNESLKTSNDYDMWFRIFRSTNVRYLPKVLIKYRLHAKQGTKTSPVYLKESNELWTGFIKELTSKEILEFESSTFAFYAKYAEQMRLSGYVDAYEYAWDLARKEYQGHNPKVTVIMPSFNTAAYLKEALESVSHQTFADFELIVVDDASTDDSVSIVRELQTKDFRVSLVLNQTRQGVSHCMNLGLEKARGEYITRMDSDDIIIPEKLEKQVKFLENNMEYGICSVDILGINEEGAQITDSLYPATDTPLNWLFLWKNPIPNAPCMYRRDLFKKVRFNKEYLIAEDYDVLSRLVLTTKVYQLDEILYKYRIHSESMFKRFTKEACENSIHISRRLAKELSGEEPPKAHEVLTDFVAPMEQELVSSSLVDLTLWVNNLLEAAKKKWGWSSLEYQNAKLDADRRIANYVVSLNKNELKEDLDSSVPMVAANLTDTGFKSRFKKLAKRVFMVSPYYRKLIRLEQDLNNLNRKLDDLNRGLASRRKL